MQAISEVGNTERLSKRVAELKPSGIRKFFDIVATMKDVISLGIGEPDFTTPKPILDAGIRSLQNGETHYTSNHGKIELRQGIGDHLQKLYSVKYDPANEIVATVGVSEALYLTFTAILEPGDEVIIPTPCFVSYQAEVIMAGGLPMEVTAREENNFMIDPADIRKAITPRTKVIHVCHITNLTGQIFPIREICRLGRARGLEVIVDGAHAFAHFPFTRDELDCDYYGTSLHKWLLAPHGTGFLYVRKEKIPGVWPLMAAPPEMNGDIRKFEEIGTHPAANHNAIAEALAFHDGIGAERKAARLRFFFHRWAKRLEPLPHVRILTPYDPAQSCGLASISIEGMVPGKVVSHLWDRHRIIVTPIDHPEFKCVRVTPNVYTTLAEIDRFGDAMEDLIRKGLPA